MWQWLGNLPVVHELSTSVQSLGHAVTGDTQAARDVWLNYADRSIIGSGVASAACAISGDTKKARKYGQGMARATAGTLAISRSIPVLHELAVASDSLGDCMAGEPEKAAEHWDHYAENSLVGSACYAAHHAIKGNNKRVSELMINSGKSLLKGGVEVAAIGIGIATAGAVAPLGITAATAISAGVGSTTSTGAMVAVAAIDGTLDQLRPGDYVGAAIGGGLAGAKAGHRAAKRHMALNNAPAAKRQKGQSTPFISQKRARPDSKSPKAPDAKRPKIAPEPYNPNSEATRDRTHKNYKAKEKAGNINAALRGRQYAASQHGGNFSNPGHQKQIQNLQNRVASNQHYADNVCNSTVYKNLFNGDKNPHLKRTQ